MTDQHTATTEYAAGEPTYRTVVGPQRHVTQAECERVVHVKRNGRLMTWGVIAGGKKEVWR